MKHCVVMYHVIKGEVAHNLSKFDRSLSVKPNSDRRTCMVQNSSVTNNAVIMRRRK